ncbi:MAG: ferredoxin [Candidatus Omnitrophica bacterium]|nr:ferredoxin [Candidatus Omnitrophota bacterium]
MRDEKDALLTVANLMCVAARTAPKARGIDNIVTKIISEKEKSRLIQRMKRVGIKENKLSFIRDAKNLKSASYVVIIGTKIKSIGLTHCSFCGFEGCERATIHKAICAYNTLDLGIAVGSAVSVAIDNRVDNRVMYSVGINAIELGILSKEVRVALGIPLSASGKNPFFDRG